MADRLALGSLETVRSDRRHTHPLDYLEQLPGSTNPYLQG